MLRWCPWNNMFQIRGAISAAGLPVNQTAFEFKVFHLAIANDLVRASSKLIHPNKHVMSLKM